MGHFVVTGDSSGLGREIKNWLWRKGHTVTGISKEGGAHGVDLSSFEDIRYLQSTRLVGGSGVIEGLINCAGVNLQSKFDELSVIDWEYVMNVNVRAYYLMAQKCLPYMTKGSVICNIVSNASHVPMTYSAVYNASKGAAHILTQQMGRELFKTHGVTVFGVSPNKLEGTQMSEDIEKQVCELRGWTPEEARDYQLKALPVGEETDPEDCARFIVNILNDEKVRRWLNCCVLPFGA